MTRRRLSWMMAAALASLACGGGLLAWKLARHSGPGAVQAAPAQPPQLKAPRIVVRKSDRRLLLLDGKKLVKVYQAATGRNGGDKEREGDQKTPEGEFYVCMKNPQSLYTLSLGLSYPNEEDADRGLDDGLITDEQYRHIVDAFEQKGQPDWYTPLGGEIMIHGARNGRTGTAGCVALEDADIRELYSLIPVGTPVTIVP